MTIPSLPKIGAPPPPPPLRKIGLEEHFGHPIVFMRDSEGRYETRKEAAVGHLGPEYFELVQERLLDFNTTRLQAMDEAGVDKVLLSFGAGFKTFGVQGFLDRVEATNTARVVNDFLAEQVRAHPTRFIGMATLALQDPAQAVRELERCVTKLGFKGVMINGYTQVDSPDNLIYLDDARMTPFWDALTALDIPLYVHPRASHKSVMFEGHPELTGAAWGFAPETATHALRIVYSGIFDRFPTAKLVLGHLGETLPFLAWRIQHGIDFSPNGRSTKKRLVDYLAENIWVTTSGNFNTQALHCTILTMGADRILFSNDYPYEDYAEGAEFMDTVAISETDRRKIAYGNAKSLYKL
ncbi:MAG TPA: amidohydrolase family protein [Steroidobacteraceae bacterium]|jgi:predicted TIM-barrel fold metal-dependent hydrolase|nr:amidohydrolase family protein [Steroidobacteraceae bacterium]